MLNSFSLLRLRTTDNWRTDVDADVDNMVTVLLYSFVKQNNERANKINVKVSKLFIKFTTFREEISITALTQKKLEKIYFASIWQFFFTQTLHDVSLTSAKYWFGLRFLYHFTVTIVRINLFLIDPSQMFWARSIYSYGRTKKHTTKIAYRFLFCFHTCLCAVLFIFFSCVCVRLKQTSIMKIDLFIVIIIKLFPEWNELLMEI